MPHIVAIRAFTDNYIWVIRDHYQAVVVDPGDAAPVLDWLDCSGATLTAILATHRHADHVGGIEALLARFPVPVHGPADEPIPGRTHALREGDRVSLPEVEADLGVLDVPGHTAGHIAYAGVVGGERVLFCGDTLFAAGCGRVFEGTPQMMWSSLSKLAALPPATRVYCAHEYTLANLRFAVAVEPGSAALDARRRAAEATRAQGRPTVPSTLALELATNPFLRVAEPEVAAAAERHAGHALARASDRFGALRAWKNAF
jgi:hydroxyacylglutathione hydrolase